MNKKLKVAIAQMNSCDSVQHNYEQMQMLVDQIRDPREIDLVSFPENSLYMRIQEDESIRGLELSDPVFLQLSELARMRKLHLHLGSVALRMEGALHNASVFIAADGRVSVTYVKIHLFDIDLPGQKPVRESDVYAPGKEPQVLTLHGWKMGQTICYDMRFAELFTWYVQHSCEAILVPSSFLVPTGKVHWEILLRARAIESQCYIIAAAQAGDHKSTRSAATRHTYGHSLVIDPWGQIMAQGNDSGPQLLEVELDPERVRAVRAQIPMSHHRRLLSGLP